MLEVAFLVLAHHQPGALLRLLDSVRAPWSHAFVHLDLKADRAAFEQVLAGRSDCTLLAETQSVSIHWGGYSMVQATFRLIAEARAFGPFTRFVLLSGMDMPIKPLETIRKRLKGDTEIIRIDRALDPAGDSHFDRCANRVYLGDHRLTNPRSTIPKLPSLIRRLEPYLRNGPYPPIPIYYGPQWWCLTRAGVDEAVRFAAENPAIMTWFSHTRCPDEMVFHTIIRNSPLAAHISHDLTRGDGEREPHLNGAHFADWDRPNPAAPRTLVAEDLPLLLESEALFGRKFDTERSADLIDALLELHGPLKGRPASAL
jgi:hypothetical protein